MKLLDVLRIAVLLIMVSVIMSANISAFRISPAKENIPIKSVMSGEQYRYEITVFNDQNRTIYVTEYVEGDFADSIQVSPNYAEIPPFMSSIFIVSIDTTHFPGSSKPLNSLIVFSDTGHGSNKSISGLIELAHKVVIDNSLKGFKILFDANPSRDKRTVLFTAVLKNFKNESLMFSPKLTIMDKEKAVKELRFPELNAHSYSEGRASSLWFVDISAGEYDAVLFVNGEIYKKRIVVLENNISASRPSEPSVKEGNQSEKNKDIRSLTNKFVENRNQIYIIILIFFIIVTLYFLLKSSKAKEIKQD